MRIADRPECGFFLGRRQAGAELHPAAAMPDLDIGVFANIIIPDRVSRRAALGGHQQDALKIGHVHQRGGDPLAAFGAQHGDKADFIAAEFIE